MSALPPKADIAPPSLRRGFHMIFALRSKSHFAQSARAVALTVSPHMQVHVSLASFTPMFCKLPGPEIMVHFPDTTCSALSVQCASQIVF